MDEQMSDNNNNKNAVNDEQTNSTISLRVSDSSMEQKLQSLMKRLLDTDKRNNLINFKFKGVNALELIAPNIEEIFALTNEDNHKKAQINFFNAYNDLSFLENEDDFDDLEEDLDEVYEPLEAKADENILALPNYATVNNISNDISNDTKKIISDKVKGRDKVNGAVIFERCKELYLKAYRAKKFKNMHLLPISFIGKDFEILKNIYKKQKSFIEERGINICNLAFGFIKWNEREDSDDFFYAPIFLQPVNLNIKENQKITLQLSDDDLIVNPAFIQKLKSEFDKIIPEYEEGLSYRDYIEKLTQIIKPKKWEVIDRCVLGLFAFHKISAYKDLEKNKDKVLAHPLVQKILGCYKGGKEHDASFSGLNPGQIPKVKEPLVDLHSVYEADSSQVEAIIKAKGRESFVLQGPPGTGKSQTITNIIAECLADGLKVLFVSEKLAALNVVYERLKKVNLDVFCANLHSDKIKSKDFATDIKDALEKHYSAPNNYEELKEQKAGVIDKLNDYNNRMHEVIYAGKTPFEIYAAFAKYRNAPSVSFTIKAIETYGVDYVNTVGDLLTNYAQSIGKVLSGDINRDYHKNVFYGYCNTNITQEELDKLADNLNVLKDAFSKIQPSKDYLNKTYELELNSLGELCKINNLLSLLEKSGFLSIKESSGRGADNYYKGIASFLNLGEEVSISDKELLGIFKASIRDYCKAGDDLTALTNKCNSWFSRTILHRSEYKAILNNLKAHMLNAEDLVFEKVLELLTKVTHYQKKVYEFKELKDKLKLSQYITFDCSFDWVGAKELLAQFKEVRAQFSDDFNFGKLGELEYPALDNELNNITRFTKDFAKVFTYDVYAHVNSLKESFDEQCLSIENDNLSYVYDRLDACNNLYQSNKQAINTYIGIYKILEKLKDYDVLAYLDKANEEDIALSELSNAFKKLYFYQLGLKAINDIDELSNFNAEKHNALIEDFAQFEKEQLAENKKDICYLVTKDKHYDVNKAISGSALNYITTSATQKRSPSIKSLLSKSGEIIQEVKPCFLMSPLSVSTYLQNGDISFDVVIFDEASQVFVEDAIGAIYRSKQVVVVGDSKQMPPTNFFKSFIDDDNLEEGEEAISYESILDCCLANMNYVRLNWHYRSRFEELIAFSNKYFYQGNLVTFPSSKAISATKEADCGVEFFYKERYVSPNRKGRGKKVNLDEANQVVDLVLETYKKYQGKRSVGVVTFNQEQMNLVERLIEKRTELEPELKPYFSADIPEPFFVKNLESVQGDERDVIIFSITFAKKSANDPLVQNFGPINLSGGERRLNVAITRAKLNLKVVSSIKAIDIDIDAKNEGRKVFHDFLDYAERGVVALNSQLSVNNQDRFDSDFEKDVCMFLREHGFSVVSQVGCSNYRIDLGVKRPNTSDFVLAVECDGKTYHSSKSARDRDRLRQSVLEGMGWKFYRIWSTDWFYNREVSQNSLLDAVNKALLSQEKVEINTIKEEPIVTENLIAKFEVEDEEEGNRFGFIQYKHADYKALKEEFIPVSTANKDRYKAFIEAVLDVEGPVNVKALLTQIKSYIGLAKSRITDRAVEEFLREVVVNNSNIAISTRGEEKYLCLVIKDNIRDIPVRCGSDREFDEISTEELVKALIILLDNNDEAYEEDCLKELNLSLLGKKSLRSATKYNMIKFLMSDECNKYIERISVFDEQEGKAQNCLKLTDKGKKLAELLRS